MKTMTKILGIKSNDNCLFDCDEIVLLNEFQDTKDFFKHYKVEINLLDERNLYEFSIDKKLGGKVALEINGLDDDILRLLNIFKIVSGGSDIIGFVEFLTNLGYDVKEPSLNLMGSYSM